MTKRKEKSLGRWFVSFQKKNISLFTFDLQQADWSSVYACDDVTYSYDVFVNIVNAAFERCLPLTKLSRKRMKDKPWVTSALKKSSRVKNALYKNWLKTQSVADEARYKNYRKVYKNIAREAELNYYKEHFDSRKKLNKKLWANLNKISSFKNFSSSASIKKLIINNKEVTEPYDICNGLNEFFTNIGENLVKDLHNQYPNQHPESYKDYCDPSLKIVCIVHLLIDVN